MDGVASLRVPRWLAWLVPALVLGGLAVLDLVLHGEAPAAGVALGMAVTAGLVALAGPWWPAQGPSLALALRGALQAVLEGVLGTVGVFLLVGPLVWLLPEPVGQRLLQDERATDLVVLMLLGAGLVVAARALWRAAAQSTRRAQAERDAARAAAALAERERALARTELALLQAQVEPHFLWNTLAHLDHLIPHDPARATRLLHGLIAYLRAASAAGRDELPPLSAEFASVAAYLDLMQIRMGERLQVAMRLDPACADWPFPRLLLHTLVENAIKHGLEPLPGPGRLEITAEPDPDAPGRLCLTVRDNGVGLQPAPASAGSGLGLRNLRERLQAHYGDAARLRIAGQAGGGFTARIECPALLSGAPA